MAVGTSGPQVKSTNRRAFLSVVFVAVFVINLDLFGVNVALPSIGRDFHGASLGSLSWVLNAYAIVFAALLVAAGRLADRNGHRRGFLVGLVVFTIGSTLCAASSNTGFLVASRAVQAVGAAVLMPTSLALLLAATAPERRSRAVRTWSAVGAVAGALGPVFGGLLVEASWRWVFLINVPIGIVAIVVGARILPDVRAVEHGKLPDLLGAAMLTVAIGALSLGLVQGSTWGWGSGPVVGGFVATAVFLVAFLAQSARHPLPVVELPLLRIRAFSSATVAAMLFTVAFAAMMLSVILWCQDVWGYSALKTGLAFAPGPLMVPPLAAAAGPLVRRFGPGPVAALGNVLHGAGLLYYAVVAQTTSHYLSQLLPGTLVIGLGVGLTLPTLNAVAASTLPPARFATGAGILNMARQIGAVLGVAILVSVLGTPHGRAAELTDFHRAWYAIVAISFLAAAVSLTVRRPKAVPSAPAARALATPAPVVRKV